MSNVALLRCGYWTVVALHIHPCLLLNTLPILALPLSAVVIDAYRCQDICAWVRTNRWPQIRTAALYSHFLSANRQTFQDGTETGTLVDMCIGASSHVLGSRISMPGCCKASVGRNPILPEQTKNEDEPMAEPLDLSTVEMNFVDVTKV